MHRSSTRFISIAAGLVSLLLVSLLVTRASNAAFTDSTENVGSSFSAGDIELVDDDTGSAMFTVADMAPGDPAQQECITVTYQGSIPDPDVVQLYSGGLTDGGLAPHLDVVVEEGTGGGSASCVGFVAGSTIFTGTLEGFDTAHTSYATGAGSWDPSGTPESRSYQVTVTLGTDTPNAAQGTDAQIDFTWEIQS